MEENEIYQIRKRDGTVVLFDRKRIRDAIWKAFRVTGEGDKDRAENLSDQVVNILNHKYSEKHPSVEQIQDIVEEVLIINKYVKTAKAYILYRSQHSQLRDLGHLMKNVEMIDSYLENDDWRIKENANMAYSLQGLNTHISSLIVSQYWLSKVYSPVIGDAHKNGDFHVHDLNTLGAYCVGWDLQDLLLSGFTGVRGKIESKPPKHFRTALGQIVNYIYTLQGETAGAQAFSNFDTYLAPFIRYDNLEYAEVKQAMQEFLFNMNVPTRVGFQTPFSNITMDLNPPDFLKDQPVIIGGKPMKETYGDFQKEMDLLNRVFTEVMIEGDASGRVFTFPIPTYNITKEFDWESDTARGVFEMTSKYGIPYFSNFINSDMSPDDARSMCCRLRLDNRELRKRGGGLFGANPLTGSIGVVTINLPRIGYLAKDEEQYFQKLNDIMDLAYQSLEAKRKILEIFTERGLYPYTRFYLRNIKKSNGEYWKNHFATIGLIGLNESIINFTGTDLISEEGREFGEKVLEFMREKLATYQQETGNVYNLEATPGEGTTYRLARLDKARYPNIVVANEEAYKSRQAAPYYTNSSQLDVSTPIDVFDALEAQDALQTKYTGGTVFHAFLGERIYDWKVAAKLVRTIAENFRLPYFTLSPTFSVCPVHGYIAGEHKYCPKCDEEIGYASALRMKASG
ncbi:ribonucleoside triphosphate reductase [Candidatus Micrarchaeota archaeon]|nr:ribonucleoside triphosphate reductase [Candidatus Micrarchaeota archaeon]MBD3417868.1 ribonucleoside triphosphate reductase [Candidatus Micrarchaeota archaeon]